MNINLPLNINVTEVVGSKGNSDRAPLWGEEPIAGDFEQMFEDELQTADDAVTLTDAKEQVGSSKERTGQEIAMPEPVLGAPAILNTAQSTDILAAHFTDQDIAADSDLANSGDEAELYNLITHARSYDVALEKPATKELSTQLTEISQTLRNRQSTDLASVETEQSSGTHGLMGQTHGAADGLIASGAEDLAKVTGLANPQTLAANRGVSKADEATLTSVQLSTELEKNTSSPSEFSATALIADAEQVEVGKRVSNEVPAVGQLKVSPEVSEKAAKAISVASTMLGAEGKNESKAANTQVATNKTELARTIETAATYSEKIGVAAGINASQPPATSETSENWVKGANGVVEPTSIQSGSKASSVVSQTANQQNVSQPNSLTLHGTLVNETGDEPSLLVQLPEQAELSPEQSSSQSRNPASSQSNKLVGLNESKIQPTPQMVQNQSAQLTNSQPIENGLDPLLSAHAVAGGDMQSNALTTPANPTQMAVNAQAPKTFAEHQKQQQQQHQQQQQQQQTERMLDGSVAVTSAEDGSQQVSPVFAELMQTPTHAKGLSVAASPLQATAASSSGQMHSLQANNPLTQSQPLESVNLATMERQLQLLEPNAAMQLRDRVLYQFNQKIHTAEVRISPEDLGTVQIKVNLQQDQLAVQFVVQQANAKELIEQQMPKLKELLQQQGMNLTEGQVEQRQSNDRQGSQQPDERQANRGYAMGTDIEVELPVTPKSTKASERMVDYYA